MPFTRQYSFLARAADNGARFRVNVYFAGLVETSAPATLTLTPDVTAPTVLSAVSAGDPTRTVVVFSEDMDPVSASYAPNYQLSGVGSAPTITSAQLGADARTVILTTSAPILEGPTYTLAI